MCKWLFILPVSSVNSVWVHAFYATNLCCSQMTMKALWLHMCVDVLRAEWIQSHMFSVCAEKKIKRGTQSKAAVSSPYPTLKCSGNSEFVVVGVQRSMWMTWFYYVWWNTGRSKENEEVWQELKWDLHFQTCMKEKKKSPLTLVKEARRDTFLSLRKKNGKEE